jgi:hypothetical protein
VTIGAGGFLAGATGRLLPASIPLRYFGAAVVFHLAAWLALLAGAGAAPRFAGGLGWPLAALHLMTLGVFAMTAMGASLQLLPVATRQPIRSLRWMGALWWAFAPAVAMVALGMGLASPPLLVVGAIVAIAALAGYAILLARNLVGAKGMPAVVTHAWVALVSLLVALATALFLAGAYAGLPGLDRATALALHVPFAAYGFMGMLALGLSHILVPMFALSRAPSERQALASCACAVIGLSLAAAAAFGVAPRPMRIAAIAAGMLAVALHLHAMRASLRGGMRRELGPSFRLVRLSWALLVASLIVALAGVLEAPFDGTATLFGALLVAGWLLTFLLGILQRIVPFLASMHAAPGRRAPPTPSGLAPRTPLAVHFTGHLVALSLLGLAIVLDAPWLLGVAALAGAVGAAAFGVFFVVVLRRMGRPRVLPRGAPVA